MRPKVGDNLPGQTYTLTQAKVDRYSRYALEGRDTENIHTNLAKAKLAGLPGPVAHGRHPVAFFSEAMLRAFGEAWIASGHLEVTMTRLIMPGETLTLRGGVTRVTAEERGDRVEVAMALVNQAGESVQSGHASVLVPTERVERR
jgi:acyl dehydratase